MVDTERLKKKNLDTDNYFMKPYYLEGVGLIYPIKIKEYKEFKELADNILVNDLTNVINSLRINFQTQQFEGKLDRFEKFQKPQYETLYDYIIDVFSDLEEKQSSLKKIILDLEKTQYSAKDEYNKNIALINNLKSMLIENPLYKLLTMVLHCNVGISNKVIYIYDTDNNVIGKIDKTNFDTFREIVMYNNLLYKPIIGYDRVSNNAIQKGLKAKSNKGVSCTTEALLSVVSVNKSISDMELQEYTMYRLMADYVTISRQHYNNFGFMRAIMGDKTSDIKDLQEDLCIYNNPYDGILQKHNGYNSLDTKLKRG